MCTGFGKELPFSLPLSLYNITPILLYNHTIMLVLMGHPSGQIAEFQVLWALGAALGIPSLNGF